MYTTAEQNILKEWRSSLPAVLEGNDPVYSYPNGWALGDKIEESDFVVNGSVKMATVLAMVCNVFGVSPDAVRGNRRHRAYIEPRCACYGLLREFFPGKSSPEIGRVLDKDRSSVEKGVAKCADLEKRDTVFRGKIAFCRARIRQLF